MKEGVYPEDFGLVMRMQRERRFTANDIKGFVHSVFSMYERANRKKRRADASAFDALLDEKVRVDFPDRKIRNRKEFRAWHRWIHRRLVADDHAVESIDVRFLSDGRYRAEILLRWRALFKDGSYSDTRLAQTWVLREEEGSDLPVIESYVARPC
jgi:hypothetical protein